MRLQPIHNQHLGWFDKQAEIALKRSTCMNYRTMLKLHILPELGEFRLTEITARIVASFLLSDFKVRILRSNRPKASGSAGFRTGLGLGELVVLQWGDIDFKHRVIRVTRNMAAGRITTPKSRSSVREVRMTSQLLEVLKGLHNNQEQKKG